MSTRALYTFKGNEGDWNVYKHHDGYVSGAARTIKMAIDLFAWPLPRYESDAFATAFIAAGKFGSWIETTEQLLEWWADYGVNGQYKKFGSNGGGVRMMPQGDPTLVACKNCSDIEYRYEVWQAKTKLHVKAFTGNWWENNKYTGPVGENLIFNGTFDDFYADALKKEAA